MLEIVIVDAPMSGRVLIMPGPARPCWNTQNRSATGRVVALEAERPMQDHELAAIAGMMQGTAMRLCAHAGVTIDAG